MVDTTIGLDGGIETTPVQAIIYLFMSSNLCHQQ